MEKEAKFWNRIAKSYAKQPIADEASYQRKLQTTREYLNSDCNILEFGCGTGSTAILHSPFVKSIKAIDISPKMIEIAKSKLAAENITNISFECSTIEKIEVPDQSYDVILGLSILHLLENKEEVLNKVYQKLKPGGVFISSTICLGDFMKVFKIIAPVGKFFGLMPLVNVITKDDLEESIKNTGFNLQHVWQPAKNKAVFIVAHKKEQ